MNLIAFEAALEEGTAYGQGERRRVVAGYNEDDCRATLALRDWLEERRAELAGRLGQDLPRPAVVGEARGRRGSGGGPDQVGVDGRRFRGDVASGRIRNGRRVLLADLLDWHRREDKPAWWRYFYLRTLSPAELIGEPDALGGLTGGEVVGQVKRSVVRRFWFPAQEHKFSPGATACDPASNKQWAVCDVDDARGTIDLKVGGAYDGPWPAALVEAGPPGTWEQRDRLRDLGSRVVRDGVTGRTRRRRCCCGGRRLTGRAAGSLRGRGRNGAGRSGPARCALRGSYLPMQGPPGTGKTYTAAEQILELIAAGRTVGITGPSHAVIHHLIDTVYEHARWRGAGCLGSGSGRRGTTRTCILTPTSMSNEELEKALRDGELDVAAGTAWLWARAEMADSVDTLFVDEAGQLSLANVLAVAGAARNLVLLGDPQQLAQPSHATHPPGAGVSALEHILGERATMPEGAGLLLDQTWRMHPELCRFTSEAFYDGKLHGVDGLDRQSILGSVQAGPAHRGGHARGEHERLAGGGPRGGAADGQLTGQHLAGQRRGRAARRPGRHPDRDAVQRADQGHPERAGGQRPGRVQGRDGRQVPGARGARGDLLHGHLVGGRRATRHGVPLRRAPAERRDLTRPGPGDHRGQPRPDPGVLPDSAADGPGQRAMPGLGNALTFYIRPLVSSAAR